MLKIIFSSEDILRTRVAPAADPVWELVLSLHLLQGRGREPLLLEWRRAVARALRTESDAEQFRLLFALNPPRGYFPDFLTPYASRDGFEAGLEAVRGTPVDMLRRDLTLLAEENSLPSPADALARGEPEVLRHLTDSMARYQAFAVTPYWSRIQAAVEADRARRARAMLDGGPEGLLASLRPSMRWADNVLEVLDYPDTRELRLDGRGLLLVPSFFCARTPVALLDPTLPPVLVYPVERLGGLATSRDADDGDREALAALIGRTRAAVLAAADDGCTTGEVARRLSISAAAASQHASVLRNAGLLVSHRDRNTVLHTLTPLGRAVLDA
ncbi:MULTISPECIES: helix-turn-helix domain-containing protein [Micromonospora]|uniref:Transcriptional regulator n=1 Tax=Micromonospora solifontis TaxID=2487138 RepID=A0ABX9WHC4_9ACTN|nr:MULTISPECIES: helix-turn-helix domain-containing protein [Micromonospora]NES15226.1 helix-turn-helix domain-containing protein [Micromonospora sp. PPF5-17B]NES36498.1 helix-turn-helix domain-containing protein [Micromonospora solifontis]NES56358.1 helix-turn-helix domain-containing protein [Micromonospora sp. PPF5-6]RNL99390.1 transcriptional regulator [Micromonospora solifontis]